MHITDYKGRYMRRKAGKSIRSIWKTSVMYMFDHAYYWLQGSLYKKRSREKHPQHMENKCTVHVQLDTLYVNRNQQPD